MATATTRKITAAILLNDGTTVSGAVKTKTIRIGGSSQGISTTTYNADLATSRQKVLNIGSPLSQCLSKAIYDVRETTEASLS